jgi:hypothetical protein
MKYDMDYRKGWYYGLGYSYCSGLKHVKVDLELATGKTKEVTIDCLNASVVNITIGRFWSINRNNVFYTEVGYAIPMKSSPWKVTDGSVLSSRSKSVLNATKPGGIIFGIGFLFGII